MGRGRTAFGPFCVWTAWMAHNGGEELESHMMFSAMLCLVVSAGVRVWVEPSLQQVMDAKEKSALGGDRARLYAARGEYESFQLCVLAEKAELKGVRVEGKELSGGIPAPEIQRVGYLHVPKGSGRSAGAGPYWPDVLLPAAPADLGRGELAVYWITFAAPRAAKAGRHRGSVEVYSGERRVARVNVRMEVFDFTLPEMPSLKVLMPLNRKAARRACGVSENTLDAWKPVYDSLSRFRVSYALFGEGDRPQDAPMEHWEYAVSGAGMACVDLGGCGAAGRFGTRDQSYVQELSGKLAEKGWLSRGTLSFSIPGSRDAWTGASKRFFEVAKMEERLPRLLLGPPYPRFERLADRWAFSFASFSPELVSRLQSGISLADECPALAGAEASSCGKIPGTEATESLADDAGDGSLSTVWVSKRTPQGNAAEWLRLDYAEPITAQEIVLAWAPEMECDDLEVSLSPDGAAFSSRHVAWDHLGGPHGYNARTSHGVLRFESTFTSIRLKFLHTPGRGPVGLAEVQFVPGQGGAGPRLGNPVAPWLLLQEQSFPALSADAAGVEARMIPWVCWGHQFEGVVYPHLNDWPEAWKTGGHPGPLWEDGGTGDAFLVYPAEGTLLPSVRLARLRDGIEDYEYLKALNEAVAAGRVKNKKAAASCARHLFAPKPGAAPLQAFAKDPTQSRATMGELLGRVGR